MSTVTNLATVLNVGGHVWWLHVKRYDRSHFNVRVSAQQCLVPSSPPNILRHATDLNRGPGQHSRYSDSLRAGRSGDHIPAAARISAPVQTGPGAHPASFTGTGSFPGVKWSELGNDHPPPTIAEVKERVKLYLHSPSGPSWPVLGWTWPLPFLPIDFHNV
jgi:hypothetical protein